MTREVWVRMILKTGAQCCISIGSPKHPKIMNTIRSVFAICEFCVHRAQKINNLSLWFLQYSRARPLGEGGLLCPRVRAAGFVHIYPQASGCSVSLRKWPAGFWPWKTQQDPKLHVQHHCAPSSLHTDWWHQRPQRAWQKRQKEARVKKRVVLEHPSSHLFVAGRVWYYNLMCYSSSLLATADFTIITQTI